jgi:uncharacterized protein YoxC
MDNLKKNIPLLIVSLIAIGLLVIAVIQGNKLKDLNMKVADFEYKLSDYETMQSQVSNLTSERDSLTQISEQLQQELSNCIYQVQLLNSYTPTPNIFEDE